MRVFKSITPILAAGWLGVAASCQMSESSDSRSIQQAWLSPGASRTQGAEAPSRGAGQSNAPPATPAAAKADPANPDDVVAYVGDRPIGKSRMVELLLASHGVGMLEQVIVYEKARSIAAEKGIAVTQGDVDAEYERGLRRLLSPLQAEQGAEFNRPEAERILGEVLSSRNISRDEYMLGVQRNAYLRALVRANMTFTEDQLRQEHARMTAPQTQIRHIQLRSLTEAERIQSLLSGGADFAQVARDYSANLRTGPAGGLLRPFDAADADVPAALRDAAFRLQPGEVSNPLRIDDWYHILKLERRFQDPPQPLESVRGDLENRIAERMIEPAMQTLYMSLFDQADIRIVDPVLKREFGKRHPGRRVNGSR